MFKNYFELEAYREQCALHNDTKAFLRTYDDTSLPEIKNENTEHEWEDRLDDIPSISDPMTSDRIKKTTALIEHTQTIETILDIGIGNAWVEKKLVKDFPEKYSFTGIDITPQNLKKLKQSLPGKYFLGNVTNPPKEIMNAEFSCILLLEVLEHVSPRNTFKALANIKKLLHKNGHLIISVPIYEDLEEKIHEGRNISKHVRRYTPAIITKELELGGFKVNKVMFFYAFSNLYVLKSLIAKLTNLRKPNVMLIDATLS